MGRKREENIWSTEEETNWEGKGGDFLVTPIDQLTNHPDEYRAICIFKCYPIEGRDLHF